MPRYEYLLCSRIRRVDDYARMLKRHSLYLMKKDAVIFKMENLGVADLPYVYQAHNMNFISGNWFLFDVYFHASNVVLWRKEILKDTDIIRHNIIKIDEPTFKEEEVVKFSCADHTWDFKRRKHYYDEMSGEPKHPIKKMINPRFLDRMLKFKGKGPMQLGVI